MLLPSTIIADNHITPADDTTPRLLNQMVVRKRQRSARAQ